MRKLCRCGGGIILLPLLWMSSAIFAADARATLGNLPANTWVKMTPTFTPAGYEYGGFGHPHGESVLVYDAAARKCVWWGGCSNGYCNQTWVYDCAADAWVEGNPDRYGLKDPAKGIYGGKYVLDDTIPQGGCSYGACFDPDAGGVIFGNSLNSGWISPPDEIARTLKPWNVWLYQTDKNHWNQAPHNRDAKKNRPRNQGGYMYCYDSVRHKTLMYGGLDAASGLCSDLYEYDSKQNAWSKREPIGAVPPPRKYHTWVFDDHRGVAIAHGGTGQRAGTTGEKGQIPISDTWEYDGKSNVWREARTSHHPPDWAARGPAAFDSDAGVLVKYCGRLSEEGPSEIWAYDPIAGDWQEMTSANPRAAHPQGVSPLYLTCYDKANHVTVLVVHGETWAYRYGRQ